MFPTTRSVAHMTVFAPPRSTVTAPTIRLPPCHLPYPHGRHLPQMRVHA